MNNNFTIRLIQPKDAEATLKIYKPYVEKTPISFEYDVPTLDEWGTRIKSYSTEYPWLVCEGDNEIIGYAYGSKHRARTAYSWSAESTIYLAEQYHRKGIARILYETLFALLKLQGYVNVYAGVTVPNAKSENFHRAVGFYEVGVYKKIGYKFGKWHDTRWFQLHLDEYPEKPSKLKTVQDIKSTEEFQIILASANETLMLLSNQ